MNDHHISRRQRAHEQAIRMQAQGGRVKVLSKTDEPGKIQRLLVLTAAAVLVAGSLLYVTESRAAGAGVHLESPRIDQSNDKSLQRGAAAFVNYCMACHTAGYQRYSRLAQDVGLSEEDVEKNLIFTTDKLGEPTKVGSLMTNNMTTDYGKQAFGVVPPNLSLTARSRGVDWIYTYLKSYYVDPEKATTGVNNLVYPDTAMPHVLWDLQGLQSPVYGEEAHGSRPITGLELTQEGSMSPDEYDDLVADITNFMAYVSDPIKETRHRVGMWVMLFLFGLLGVTYLLKKEYWKDVV
ncbi:cytochrome c1 [Granulosicoccus antarcticus]|uniref:Cytochrome b/c1 n=1 Tax=Granulosicoccus antarcticus IMCC3135 TaxID=1192854 RepID=A0A2Z2NXC4_9GAMM|nr:cytochrome c1 [Granulosicoccus antarcticus]ASJ75903.1 Cytochrome b/c1 [Granulosicoccus antarcticus IMCC3135]